MTLVSHQQSSNLNTVAIDQRLSE